ncbi:MAG: hypothetical protein AAB229_05980, partial [Candidatus Hydrogenedentota bacterium]
MITRNPRRFFGARLLVILGVSLILLAGLAIVTLPSTIKLAAGRWAESQGLILVLDGLHVGKQVVAEHISVRLASQPLPFLEARGVVLGPKWSECVRGRWMFGLVEADSVAVLWNEALAEWLDSRPPSKGKAAAWGVASIHVPAWSASVLGWTVTGAMDVMNAAPGGVDSALVRFATLKGIEGICSVEAGSARVSVRGAGIPVAVRAIPGMDQSADTWTIVARASSTPVPRAAAGTLLRGPAWFEALLDHGFHGRAEILAESGATGFLALDAAPESGHIVIDGRVGTMLTVGGTSAFSGDTLRTRIAYHATRPGDAVLDGRLELDLLPLDGMRILEGSAFTLAQGNVRGARLPAGRIDFSGDNRKGFHLTSDGELGKWEADLNTGKSEMTWRGVLRARRAGSVRDLMVSGRVEARLQPAGITWSAGGTLSGIADAGATPVKFQGEGEGSGIGERIGLRARAISLEPAKGAASWRLNLADLKVEGTASSWKAGLGTSSSLRLHGRSLPLKLEAKGGQESIELNPVSVGGVTVRARAVLAGGRYRETRVTIEETPLMALAAFLPPPQKTILDRSEVAGQVRGEFRHSSDRRIDGSLHLDVKKFHDPVSDFLVENLTAEIPIRQRFVDPGKVQVTDADRWPDVPVNLRIGALGQKDIMARDLSGRAVFADYVFRFRDISFAILGGLARSRFILDPFRDEMGRWRAALELKVDGVPLANLYEAFIGKGSVARTMKGEINFEMETAWTDTKCHEGKGSVAAPQPGRIGHKVISALVQMLDKEKR